MTEHLEKLHAQAEETDRQIRTIEAAVEAADRTMTPEEIAQVSALTEKFNQLTAEIDLRKKTEDRQAKLAAPAPRKVEPTQSATQAPVQGATSHTFTGGTLVAHNWKNHGFEKGPGEFLVAVMNSTTTRRTDPRLIVNAQTTYGSEGVAADGGFALPPQFAQGLLDVIMPADGFLAALNPVQTNSNLLVVPNNQNAPWQNTAGITAAATSEAGTITASKPALSELRVPLYKYASLVHVSEETLADIPFMASWVMNQMGQHLKYLLEDAVINGRGVGQIEGILNSPALISLTDADSTATAIGAYDILAMEASLLYGGSAFFVSNPTVMPAIATMKSGTAGFPLYQPDMTVPSKRALLGRPFYNSEACPILNTTGDILLIQPSGYIFATKAGGVQTATTVGFAFDQDMQSFRATLRAGGAGVLSAKVARAKSASSYASHFVAITGSRS